MPQVGEDHAVYMEKRFHMLRSLLRSGEKIDINLFKDIIVDPILAGRYLEGIVLRNRNRAEPILREIVESDPDCLPAEYLLVKVLSAECRYDDIEYLVIKCMDACSSSLIKAYLLYLLGSVFINVNNDKAFSYLKAASEAGEPYVDILMDCAQAMVSGGWRDEAKKLLKRVYKLLEPATALKKTVKQILKTGDLELLKEIDFTAGMVIRYQLSITEEEFNRILKYIRLHSKKYKTILKKVVGKTPGGIPKSDTQIYSLLEKYSKTGYLTDDDVNIWIDILDEKRPGFEMYLGYRFFQDKCGSCCHPQGPKAEKGEETCPLDAEFLEYIYENVEEIVKKLGRGENISNIPELNVPEWISRRVMQNRRAVNL
jgi:hypothetical protein